MERNLKEQLSAAKKLNKPLLADGYPSKLARYIRTLALGVVLGTTTMAMKPKEAEAMTPNQILQLANGTPLAEVGPCIAGDDYPNLFLDENGEAMLMFGHWTGNRTNYGTTLTYVKGVNEADVMAKTPSDRVNVVGLPTSMRYATGFTYTNDQGQYKIAVLSTSGTAFEMDVSEVGGVLTASGTPTPMFLDSTGTPRNTAFLRFANSDGVPRVTTNFATDSKEINLLTHADTPVPFQGNFSSRIASHREGLGHVRLGVDHDGTNLEIAQDPNNTGSYVPITNIGGQQSSINTIDHSSPTTLGRALIAVKDTGTTTRIVGTLLPQSTPDAGVPDAMPPDAMPLDSGPGDAGVPDAMPADSGPRDGGVSDAMPLDAMPVDSGPGDGGVMDGGSVNPADAGNMGPDATPIDSGMIDGGVIDGGSVNPADAGNMGPECIVTDGEIPSSEALLEQDFTEENANRFAVLREGFSVTAGNCTYDVCLIEEGGQQGHKIEGDGHGNYNSFCALEFRENGNPTPIKVEFTYSDLEDPDNHSLEGDFSAEFRYFPNATGPNSILKAFRKTITTAWKNWSKNGSNVEMGENPFDEDQFTTSRGSAGQSRLRSAKKDSDGNVVPTSPDDPEASLYLQIANPGDVELSTRINENTEVVTQPGTPFGTLINLGTGMNGGPVPDIPDPSLPDPPPKCSCNGVRITAPEGTDMKSLLAAVGLMLMQFARRSSNQTPQKPKKRASRKPASLADARKKKRKAQKEARRRNRAA